MSQKYDQKFILLISLNILGEYRILRWFSSLHHYLDHLANSAENFDQNWLTSQHCVFPNSQNAIFTSVSNSRLTNSLISAQFIPCLPNRKVPKFFSPNTYISENKNFQTLQMSKSPSRTGLQTLSGKIRARIFTEAYDPFRPATTAELIAFDKFHNVNFLQLIFASTNLASDRARSDTHT